MNTQDFLKLPFVKREKQYYNEFPDAKQLKRTLLKIGGKHVVWLPTEPHPSALLENGHEFATNKRKKIKGEANRCHDNAVKLFLEKDIGIATGYAISFEMISTFYLVL